MSVFHNNILAGASGASGAAEFKIERSLRFNNADTAYLNRTPSSASNRRTWTWSAWLKKCAEDTRAVLFSRSADSSNRYVLSLYQGNFYFYSTTSGSQTLNVHTSGEFRDPSAWYHVVFVFDTTQATANDRTKIYVNGVQPTLNYSQQPSQNAEFAVNTAAEHRIGGDAGSSEWLNSYLTEVNFVDGQALAATDFGEYDDNNVWQAKDTSGLTFGTNGFRLKVDDNSSNSALGSDSSGNNNDWTVNNISIGTSFPFSAEFDGSTSQYIRKAGDGVLPENNGNFTVECHFLPHTNSVRGLFDGGAGETSIIRNYDANAIGRQQGPTVDITGDYTVNDWNHMAACYNGSTDTLNVFINGTSSGTCSFSSYSGGSNFDIGTINAGGDGKFNGLIRNFRVTNTVVYSSNFTAPSHTSNLTNISGTQLLLFTTNANGLLTDGSSANRTLTNNGGVSPYIPGADNDSLIDTPMNLTASSGNNNGNYATLNPLAKSSNVTLSNGNLEASVTSDPSKVLSTIGMSSGKYYAEFTVSSGSINPGLATSATNLGSGFLGNDAGSWCYGSNGKKYHDDASAVGATYGATYAAGDVIGVAFDADNGTLTFYKNGSSQGTAYTGLTYGPYFFAAGGSNSSYHANFGQRSFAYTPPSNHLALVTTNLADPTIADGSDYFDVKTYSGTGSTQSITGLAFSPDLVWIKNRSVSDTHAILDTHRGTNTVLSSNLANGDRTEGGSLTAFNSDGFTVGSYNDTNRSSSAFVAWTWDAGSSAASNTDGSITSSVRANTSAGFSIISYTGNNTSGATIGHGLNAAVEFAIFKQRGVTNDWSVYHKGAGATGYLRLNLTDAFTTTSGQFNNTHPSASVITLGSDHNANGPSNPIICYAWAPVEGYSAFGSYTGNGQHNNDLGPFIFTGFRPAFLMFKRTDSTGAWEMYDSTRSPENPYKLALVANTSGAEYNVGSYPADMLSNGFKIRHSGSNVNASGGTYIYMAFAEHPFKTARAR